MDKIWRQPGPLPPPVCAECPPSTPLPLGTYRSSWPAPAPGSPAGTRSRSSPCRRLPTESTNPGTPTAARCRTSFLLFHLVCLPSSTRVWRTQGIQLDTAGSVLFGKYEERSSSGGEGGGGISRIRFNGVEKVHAEFRDLNVKHRRVAFIKT